MSQFLPTTVGVGDRRWLKHQGVERRGEGALISALHTAREVGGCISIGSALDAYVGYLKVREYSPQTIACVKVCMSAFYRSSGLKPPDELACVTREVADRVFIALNNYSENTRYRYCSLLLQIFRAFSAGGILLENPFATIICPKKPRHLAVITLTEEEIEQLMNVAATPSRNHPLVAIRNRAILEFFYSTGVRMSELLNLELTDIDFEQGMALVRKGKGNKDRWVPFGREAARWLMEYLTKFRPRYAGELPFLWVGEWGRRMQVIFLERIISALGKKAGIAKPVTAHVLRRTCASHMLSGGASAMAVIQILGHSGTGNLSRYLRIESKELKDVHSEKHPRS